MHVPAFLALVVLAAAHAGLKCDARAGVGRSVAGLDHTADVLDTSHRELSARGRQLAGLDTMLLKSQTKSQLKSKEAKPFGLVMGSANRLLYYVPATQEYRVIHEGGVVRQDKMFTQYNHLNTISPMTADELWGILHNNGVSQLVNMNLTGSKKSQLVKMNLAGPTMVETAHLSGIGRMAHGLVKWRGDFIILSSQTSEVVKVNAKKGCWEVIYKGGTLSTCSMPGWHPVHLLDARVAPCPLVRCQGGTLSTCSMPGWHPVHLFDASGVPEPAKCKKYNNMYFITSALLGYLMFMDPRGKIFIKGLAVVDDVAYFCMSIGGRRKVRVKADNNCELGALDLTKNVLLWKREVPSAGLTNVIAAPELGESSTYRAQHSGSPKPAADLITTLNTKYQPKNPFRLIPSLEKQGFPTVAGGYWPNGLPYIDMSLKASSRPWTAGLYMPLTKVPVGRFSEYTGLIPEAAWSELPREGSRRGAAGGRTVSLLHHGSGIGLHPDTAKAVKSDKTSDLNSTQFNETLRKVLGKLTGYGNLSSKLFYNIEIMQVGSTVLIPARVDAAPHSSDVHRIVIPLQSLKRGLWVCPKHDISKEVAKHTQDARQEQVCPKHDISNEVAKHTQDARQEQASYGLALDTMDCLDIDLVQAFAF
eukprot:gene18684-25204_t